METLGLATTSYNFLHKYLDNPSYTKPASKSTQSPLEIICRIQTDNRFDGLFEHGGADNIEPVFEKRETEVLEYWNSWRISNPTKDFEGSQKLAAALLVAAHKPDGKSYDFFIVHLLTTSHAVRIVLPFLPAKFHVPLVRQWWLLTIAVYIAQLRPEILLTSVTDFDRKGRDWNWVDKQAVEGKHALDEHYVKALRSLKEAARTWGDEDEFYLKAAIKFGDEFDGWGGFSI